MANMTVYDKVSWHYPEGKICLNLEAAKAHFTAIMEWLKENRLLSGEGEEIFEIGIDADFSITSSMLTESGNDVLEKNYSRWLKAIDYSGNIHFKILDDGLREFISS